jgi:hypothetical protein
VEDRRVASAEYSRSTAAGEEVFRSLLAIVAVCIVKEVIHGPLPEKTNFQDSAIGASLPSPDGRLAEASKKEYAGCMWTKKLWA